MSKSSRSSSGSERRPPKPKAAGSNPAGSAKSKPPAEKKVAKCYFETDKDSGPCNGPVEFCHGCKQNVCDRHSVNFNLPFGGHEPYDHLENEDDLEEENED